METIVILWILYSLIKRAVIYRPKRYNARLPNIYDRIQRNKAIQQKQQLEYLKWQEKSRKQAIQLAAKREKQEKQLQAIKIKKDLASTDIERTQVEKQSYLELLELIETELETASDKRKIQLTGKKISVEKQIYNLDRKIDKLYSIIYN